MRTKRIVIGTVLMVVFVGIAATGVVVLRESLGGGVRFTVSFEDTRSLEIDDDVVYGDKVVGRVTDIRGNLVHAVVESEKAMLIHEGSRFWIVSNVVAVLQFDTPASSGKPIGNGYDFTGFDTVPEPDPDSLPPQQVRPLAAVPTWLCEIRATIRTEDEAEVLLSIRRKSAAAVVQVTVDGDAIVLAPNWVHDVAGALPDATYLIEMQGDETRLAELLDTDGELSRFIVRNAGYEGSVASIYSEQLPQKQPLLLTNHDGDSYKVKYLDGQVNLRLIPNSSLLALVDGFNLAGFAVPVRGERYGARWIGLETGSSSD
ncbi:MAG: MlaD family protein [Planctomycetota bacterium]